MRFRLFFENLQEKIYTVPVLFVKIVLQNKQIMKKEKQIKFDYAKVQDINIIFAKCDNHNVVTFGSTKGGLNQ